MTGRIPIACALLTVLMAAACGGQAAAPSTRPRPSPLAIPPGYTAYTGSIGFRVAIAPGWTAGAQDAQGVTFADPAGKGLMLVHVEAAPAADAEGSVSLAMAELTAGAAGRTLVNTEATLGGFPARRIGASFEAAGALQQVLADIAQENGRVWVVALVGQEPAFTQDRGDWERMAATFQLLGRRPSPPARLVIGLPAPGFPELDAIRGPVVLNFFATWCGPCRSEMPLLADRARQAAGRYSVLGVDTRDDPSAVPAFLRELKVGFPTAADPTGRLADEYQLPGVPATFFLDGRHVARAAVLGPLTRESLDGGLAKMGAG